MTIKQESLYITVTDGLTDVCVNIKYLSVSFYRDASKNGNHLHVVFLILEDVLTVNAPEHHMIESVPSAIVRA